MFRRRSKGTNESLNNKRTSGGGGGLAVVAAPPPPPNQAMEQTSPLGNAGTGMMWYKKPTTAQQQHSPPHNTTTRQSGSSSTTAIKSNRRRRISDNNDNNNNHNHNNATTTGSSSPANPDLFALLLAGNWNSAQIKIHQDPSCLKQKQSIKLLGHHTTAYPLHLTVCTQAPIPVLDNVMKGFSNAIQIPDDYLGRLPLHWGCIASASPTVLQKLIGLYPAACKTLDRIHGRLPVHYIVMNATILTQVSVLLEATDVRGLSIKDKHSKTPVDLAQDSSNPLKLDIISLLQRRMTAKHPPYSHRHHQRGPSPPRKEHEHAMKQVQNDEWETPLNANVNKATAAAPPSSSGASRLSNDYKLPVHHHAPTFRSSGNGKNHHNANNNYNAIPKAPNTGGFFLDRTTLRTKMDHNINSSRSVVSTGVGSAEDPGPKTNTNSELPPPPPDMGRSETWAAAPDTKQAIRRSVQDNIVRDAFDFTNNDPIPLDPLSQPAAHTTRTGKQQQQIQQPNRHQHQQRRPSGSKVVVPQSTHIQKQQQAVPPTHPSRKLKSPPRVPSPQQLQQQQSPHSPTHHQMPPISSKPTSPATSKRRSAPAPPSPKHHAQTMRRSDPALPGGGTIGVGAPVLDDNSTSKTSKTPAEAERDFFRRHDEKMRRYTPAVRPGVVFEKHPPSSNSNPTTASTRKEEEVMGRNLVENMNSTIRGLSEKITRRERELQEKVSQLADLDVEINQMNATEILLSNDLDMAKAGARQGQEAFRLKQKRISDIKHQIQRLQAELRAEETDVRSMDGSIQMFLDNEDRAQNKLRAHRDEQGSLKAVRQALADEKACIVRDIDNSNSELKSLEAIQNLAMRDDSM